MSQQDNLTIVKEIYEAVGRGDVAAIVGRVSEDVDWAAEAAGKSAPWHGPRVGRDGVVSFFTDLATSIEIIAFTPHSFAAGEDDVHLLVDWTIRPVTTGREASMTMHHYWRLHDGEVTYFRGSEDTELTAQVFAT
jgi:ketosteroid isomerase-like protein